MGFTTFGLSDRILNGVRAAGHTTPTPIQALAIAPALEGRDIVATANTGTGKTAAFVLPILQRLASDNTFPRGHRHPRALILTPTRELAHQIEESISLYGRFLALRAMSIYGGVSMNSQLLSIRGGVDILVATPGRLLDHMQQRTIELSSVEVLVLDEADRMLDMGFIKDVRRIISAIPAKRQTLLFSATLSEEITDLASRILKQPHTVEAGHRRNPADTITQHFYRAEREAKMSLLLHALQEKNLKSVLVFSRTKHGADKICRRLERQGVAAVAIHSNRTQVQRERALEGFKRGNYRVLVATDIAARGIDVTAISHVINYDVPLYAEDYIHRIGRTGRAGAAGDAITLVSREEEQYVRRIEHFVGKRFTLQPYPAKLGPMDLPAQREAHPMRVSTPFRGKAPRKRGQGSRQQFLGTPKKKRQPAKHMEVFSTAGSGGSWSNR